LSEINEISKNFSENAFLLNQTYRLQNNFKLGYCYKNFVIEGKVLYCLDENNQLTDRESIYKVKPSDIEGSHCVQFDAAMQYKALEALAKLYSKGEKFTEQNLKKELDMNDRSWDAFGKEIMDLTTGVPNYLTEKVSSQKLLVMVGVPGSGKSTVANKLVTQNKLWFRVNQDEMKTRGACETYAKDAFKKGLSVIVDRCNFDITQRNKWIKIATEYGVNHMWCLYFNIPHEICKNRITIREDHPTIPKGDTGIKIIDQFASSLVDPFFEEGFSEIISVTNDLDLENVFQKLLDFPRMNDATSTKKEMKNKESAPKEKEKAGFFNPFKALEGIDDD